MDNIYVRNIKHALTQIKQEGNISYHKKSCKYFLKTSILPGFNNTNITGFMSWKVLRHSENP